MHQELVSLCELQLKTEASYLMISAATQERPIWMSTDGDTPFELNHAAMLTEGVELR
jgi:hypothetical protein